MIINIFDIRNFGMRPIFCIQQTRFSRRFIYVQHIPARRRMTHIEGIVEHIGILELGRGDVGGIGAQRRDNKASGQRQAGY